MIKFLCKKDSKEFPKTKKGKIYYGIYDEDEDIWLIDEFWIKEGVNENNFDLEYHGSYVRNKSYFEVIK